MTASEPTKRPLTEGQSVELNRRVELLKAYDQFRSEEPNAPMTRAAEMLGVSVRTLERLIDARNANPAAEALIPKVSSGRKSLRAKLEKECGAEAIGNYLVKARGHVLDTGTVRGTLRFLAKTDTEMPIALRAAILDDSKRSKHNIAPSLVEPVKVTPAESLAHRGPKALKLFGLYIPIHIEVLPGDVFVPDDTTPIFGWWVPWPKSDKYPFGKKVLQGQLLEMVDYASGFRISYSLIAREKSSYRAVDIYGWFGDTFDSCIPRLGFQLEGGSWQARIVRGEEVDFSDDNGRQTRRVGALNSLPSSILPYHERIAGAETLRPNLHTWRSTVPKSKPIEAAFRMEQTFEGMLWGALGRDQRRVPIENTKKIFEACQAGKADPGLHFLSWTEIMPRITKILEFLNWDRMEGRSRYGRPEELWRQSIEANPLLTLPEEDRWLYRRNWVSREVRGAFADCSYKDEVTARKVPLHYHNAELFAQLDGQRVLVYYDRENPETPADVIACDSRATRLGQAQFWSGTGAFISGNPEGFEIQAQWLNAVKRATKVMHEQSPSRQLPAEIKARREAAAALIRAEGQTPLSATGARGQGNPFARFSGGADAPVARREERQTTVRAMSYDEMVEADLPPARNERPIGANQPGECEPGNNVPHIA
jgi:hypothetical protein